ncbi:MAG: hypothetical protein WA948_02860 [Pontixanthobacter sp.]
MKRTAFIVGTVLLAGCSAGDGARVTQDDSAPFAQIAEGEVVRFTGTEPFWGGEVVGEQLIYTTPENPDGATIQVRRFAGMNGLGYSGTLDGAAFDLAITPGTCSDQMSDRSYPYTATLRLGDETRNGCAFTDAQPFAGPKTP